MRYAFGAALVALTLSSAALASPLPFASSGSALNPSPARPLETVSLTATRAKDGLIVAVEGGGEQKMQSELWLIGYQSRMTNPLDKPERVITGFQPVGTWTGAKLQITFPSELVPPGDHVALILQRADGVILASTELGIVPTPTLKDGPRS